MITFVCLDELYRFKVEVQIPVLDCTLTGLLPSLVGLENLAKPIPFVPHLKESYRVIVVRHPLERLLSAYLYVFLFDVPGEKKPRLIVRDVRRRFVDSAHCRV